VGLELDRQRAGKEYGRGFEGGGVDAPGGLNRERKRKGHRYAYCEPQENVRKNKMSGSLTWEKKKLVQVKEYINGIWSQRVGVEKTSG